MFLVNCWQSFFIPSSKGLMKISATFSKDWKCSNVSAESFFVFYIDRIDRCSVADWNRNSHANDLLGSFAPMQEIDKKQSAYILRWFLRSGRNLAERSFLRALIDVGQTHLWECFVLSGGTQINISTVKIPHHHNTNAWNTSLRTTAYHLLLNV